MKGNALHTVLKNVSDSYEEFMNGLESVAGGTQVVGDLVGPHSPIVLSVVKLLLQVRTHKHDSLVIDNVSVKVGNCVPNSIFNVDYRALEMENLRSNKSLVQRVEEQMANLGLFAEKDQQHLASFQLEGGKINNKYSLQVNSEKLQSGAEDVVSSSIKSKIIWPQSKLKLSHANKKYKFQDLPSFHLLVAGETACLLSTELAQREKEAHLALLQETAYLCERVHWEVARDFHFNVMLGIERGDRKWEHDTLDIQTALLISSTSGLEKGGHAFSGGSKSASSKKSEPGQCKWWCLDFQKGTCLFKGPHESFIRGSKKWIEHVCSTCIQKNRVIRYHSEKDGECPFNQKGGYSGLTGG